MFIFPDQFFQVKLCFEIFSDNELLSMALSENILGTNIFVFFIIKYFWLLFSGLILNNVIY